MRDFKTWVISLFIIVSIILTAMAVMVSAEERGRNSARAATLYSPDTKSFLYEKNADVRLPMASTTKIMTALIVIENEDLDKVIEVHPDSIGVEGSSIYLKEGDRLTVRDLLYSLLLQSANDAATALAYEVGGSIEGFASMMNLRAKELGLTDTSFDNPHGLDSENHYTTAKELALITAEAMNNQCFADIVSTYKYSFTIDDSPRTVVNHNKLLKQYDGAIGVKTGFTKKSGRCLVGAAKRNGISLICVTLDAPSDWSDHRTLFDYGFDSLNSTYISELTKTDFEIPLINGKKEYISASIRENLPLVSQKSDVFTAEINIKRFISCPVYTGDVLGNVTVYKNGEFYTTIDIVSNESIEKTKENGIFDIFK